MNSILLALLLAAEPAALPPCTYTQGGAGVFCPTLSFEALMDDLDQAEAATTTCKDGAETLRLRSLNELTLAKASCDAEATELKLRLEACKPVELGWFDRNRAPLSYGAGLVGTMLLAFGVGLAASDAEPSLWGPLLGVGLAVDVGGAVVALSGE